MSGPAPPTGQRLLDDPLGGITGQQDSFKRSYASPCGMPREEDLAAIEGRIRRNLTRHLRSLGFGRSGGSPVSPVSDSKAAIRVLHDPQRRDRLRKSAQFIRAAWPRLSKYFAEGTEVIPERINPSLEIVEPDTEGAELFRLATLTWRIPVSNGYGRRIRCLLRDTSNWKLIGLFALGDPVFNQSARDCYVGWTADQRAERLVDVMDAYVVGAVPPYNALLGAKLVASLIRTQEVKKEFVARYRDSTGIISGVRKHAQLVLVTTSSALGKSSVYDRLKVGRVPYFQSIGFTEGWGHFQIPDRLFAQMRAYLAEAGHWYALNYEFGDGPNWRLRTTKAALGLIGVNQDLMRHGIRREVYVCAVAKNALDVLRGEAKRAKYPDLLPARAVSDLAIQRWVIPRALRRPEFRDWSVKSTKALLDHRCDGSVSLLFGVASRSPAPPKPQTASAQIPAISVPAALSGPCRLTALKPVAGHHAG